MNATAQPATRGTTAKWTRGIPAPPAPAGTPAAAWRTLEATTPAIVLLTTTVTAVTYVLLICFEADISDLFRAFDTIILRLFCF